MSTIIKRSAESRGKTELGWLHSRHSFSFGDYYDPKQMGFRSLRVINDDIVDPGQGFGTHAHANAEIFSYVIEGQLEHRDSLGNGSIIEAGNLQYMSAGSGVRHSEFNPSKTDRVHFLQVWLLPNVEGGAPRYAEMNLAESAQPNTLTQIFYGETAEGTNRAAQNSQAIPIRQDANIYFGKLEAGKTLTAPIAENRHAWFHVISGELLILGETLKEGDSAAIANPASLELSARQRSEFLLFDLA